MNLNEVLAQHKDALVAAAASAPFIVFLCGPALRSNTVGSSRAARLLKSIREIFSAPNKGSLGAAARLRNNIKEHLEKENFDIVLGEDDGLENARLSLGINAQDNELEFVCHHCNAIIIVADSVGSFCELGLFSWHYVHEDGSIRQEKTDFVVLVDQKYARDRSYLNDGPVAAVNGFGRVEFVNFETYSAEALVRRLRDRRGVVTVDRRGRPPGVRK